MERLKFCCNASFNVCFERNVASWSCKYWSAGSVDTWRWRWIHGSDELDSYENEMEMVGHNSSSLLHLVMTDVRFKRHPKA